MNTPAGPDASRPDLQRLLALLGELPVAVFQIEIDAGGQARALYVAPQVHRILGVTADEILADATARHRNIHPDDAPSMQQRLAERQARVATGQPCDPLDTRRYMVDGQVRWVRVVSHGTTPHADGGVLWTGYYEDVTERRREELALRRAHDEQQAILEAATTGICFTRDGLVLRANAALLTMLRSTAQALIGRPVAELYADPDYGHHLAQSINPRLAQGDTFRIAVRLRRDDGSDFWTHISGHAIDPPDLGRGLVWIVEDVTESLQAQQALVRAKNQAEEAARAKSDFLAAMSHEVRTPLNAIMGTAQLLASSTLTAEQAAHLERLRSAGRHLMRLLNDILEFTRMNTGELQLSLKTFQLDQLLAEVAASIHAPAQGKGLRLEVHLQPDLPHAIVGDAERLAQVLRGFADNAVKFTRQGTVRIAASAVDRSERHVLLRLAVTDTGIGMTAEQQARLFIGFEQADMSATRRHRPVAGDRAAPGAVDGRRRRRRQHTRRGQHLLVHRGAAVAGHAHPCRRAARRRRRRGAHGTGCATPGSGRCAGPGARAAGPARAAGAGRSAGCRTAASAGRRAAVGVPGPARPAGGLRRRIRLRWRPDPGRPDAGNASVTARQPDTAAPPCCRPRRADGDKADNPGPTTPAGAAPACGIRSAAGRCAS